jgi:hypothetical protein
MKIDKQSKGRLLALLMAGMLTIVGLVIFSGSDSEGALSEESDDFGYRYIDSENPAPKTTYDWYDASSGTTINESMTSSYAYVEVTMPFDFPFYENSYNYFYIHNKGYIQFPPVSSTTYSSSYEIPTSSGPNNVIAVWWGYPYAYTNTGTTPPTYYYGPIYYTVDPSNEFVCVSWETLYTDITYQCLLYKTGLIKMQYKDADSTSTSYDKGYYAIVGVENSDGSDGLLYSGYYDANIHSGLAIEWASKELSMSDVDLENGRGEDENICFAEYEYYDFNMLLNDSQGWEDISWANIYFGDPSMEVGLRYFQVPGGAEFTYIGKSDKYLEFDENVYPRHIINDLEIRLDFSIMFFFEFPMTGNLSITVLGRGGATVPTFKEMPDVLYVENMVKLRGEISAVSETGRVIENGGYSRQSETVTFTGASLIYNNTYGNITPPESVYYFMMVDELGNTYYDRNISGRNISFEYVMPGEAVTKEFTISLMNISSGRMLTEIPVFFLNIDDTKPPAPLLVMIHADSFKDPNVEADNDDTVFVTWSRVSDLGSGVACYRITDEYDVSNLDDAPSVGAGETEYVWDGTTHGELNLYVWAEDLVGHHGDVKAASIFIDKIPPSLSADTFTPDVTQWQKSLTPKCSIKAYDEGVGIDGESLEYSISTNGTDNFEEWISAEVYEDGSDVDVSVTPRFVEGMNNVIRFRAKDIAGNGYVTSDNFTLKIDVTEVEYRDMFPTQDVWHSLNVVNDRPVEVYLYDGTSGVDAAQIYYRISVEKTDDGGPKWETGIQEEGGWVKYTVKSSDRLQENNLVRVTFPFDGFLEGEDNIIQFRSKDIAKNGADDGWTLSPQYVVKVNTKPVANILRPTEGEEFKLDELLTLDGSGSYDVDLDQNNLKYEWKVGNKSLGRDRILENVRFDIKGRYTINLYVGDSSHRYNPDTGEDTRAVAVVNISIVEEFISPVLDTDGDGMVDLWEYENSLDMNDPRDASEDPDRDGYTNLEEYYGIDGIGPYHGQMDSTDPWDITEHPNPIDLEGEGKTNPAPFDLFWFIIMLVVGILVGAVIILWGYLRMNRGESKEKRQEAEEDAMLVTPQLDIPAMPQMPMVDTSVPTLPQGGEGYDQSQMLPPAGENFPEQPLF